jgi:hypothetical protein
LDSAATYTITHLLAATRRCSSHKVWKGLEFITLGRGYLGGQHGQSESSEPLEG